HEDAKRSFAIMQQIGREATGRVPEVESISEVFEQALIQYRTSAWVAGILAGISLTVAVIGLHGVMSFAVNQRVREIGIRMALGATPGRVVSSIVYETLGLVAAGSAVGYGLSVLISKVARSMLQGVEPFNPWAGVAVLLLLAAIGLLACWVPARRAARVDPMVALRAE
ncbi:MAG TPA: FtsX-like permease family protein, partial [Lacunisphaera sp.]|nr:FtsX-like permease family protein [Lacunisphaera sp.]